MSREDLILMRGASPNTCDPRELVELQSIRIDRSKPPQERMAEYIHAVGNPYLFKVGDVTVKLRFASQGKVFADAMADILLAG